MPSESNGPRANLHLRILHVWNTAGVGSVIAKYMDKLLGTRSLVVNRRAFDPYGVTTFGELWDDGAKIFTLKCILKARGFDFVHVHYFDRIVPLLKYFYPKKPVVLHYHGDDIRHKWSLRRKYWKKADAILYSTSDLQDDETPRHAIYMPNPVDTEIFHPCSRTHESKTAFHIFYNADDLANEYATRYGLQLTIHHWKTEGRIPHLKLAETFCQYEYYIDARKSPLGDLIKVPLSKTALEALACGLKVVTWDGKIVNDFPSENRPGNVVRQIFNVYSAVSRR